MAEPRIEFTMASINENIKNELIEIVKEFAEKDRFDENGTEIYQVYEFEITVDFMVIPYVRIWTWHINKDLYYTLNKDRCVHTQGVFGKYDEQNPTFYSKYAGNISNRIEYILEVKEF